MDHTAQWDSAKVVRPLFCPYAGSFACPVQLPLPGRSANQWSALHGWTTPISSLSAEESTRVFSTTQLCYSPAGPVQTMECSSTTGSRWATTRRQIFSRSGNSKTAVTSTSAVSESSAFLFTSLQRIPGLPVPTFVPSAQVARWQTRRSKYQVPESSSCYQVEQVPEHGVYPHRNRRSSSFQVVSRNHRRHQRADHGPQYATRSAQKSPGFIDQEAQVGRASYFSSLRDPVTAAAGPVGDQWPPGSREGVDCPHLAAHIQSHGCHGGSVSSSPASNELHVSTACTAAGRDGQVHHTAPVRPRPPRRRPKAGARSSSGLPGCTHSIGRSGSTVHSLPPSRYSCTLSCTSRHANYSTFLRQRGPRRPGLLWTFLTVCISCLSLWQLCGLGGTDASFWGHLQGSSGCLAPSSTALSLSSAHWLRLASGKQGEQALVSPAYRRRTPSDSWGCNHFITGMNVVNATSPEVTPAPSAAWEHPSKCSAYWLRLASEKQGQQAPDQRLTTTFNLGGGNHFIKGINDDYATSPEVVTQQLCDANASKPSAKRWGHGRFIRGMNYANVTSLGSMSGMCALNRTCEAPYIPLSVGSVTPSFVLPSSSTSSYPSSLALHDLHLSCMAGSFAIIPVQCTFNSDSLRAFPQFACPISYPNKQIEGCIPMAKCHSAQDAPEPPTYSAKCRQAAWSDDHAITQSLIGMSFSCVDYPKPNDKHPLNSIFFLDEQVLDLSAHSTVAKLFLSSARVCSTCLAVLDQVSLTGTNLHTPTTHHHTPSATHKQTAITGFFKPISKCTPGLPLSHQDCGSIGNTMSPAGDTTTTGMVSSPGPNVRPDIHVCANGVQPVTTFPSVRPDILHVSTSGDQPGTTYSDVRPDTPLMHVHLDPGHQIDDFTTVGDTHITTRPDMHVCTHHDIWHPDYDTPHVRPVMQPCGKSGSPDSDSGSSLSFLKASGPFKAVAHNSAAQHADPFCHEGCEVTTECTPAELLRNCPEPVPRSESEPGQFRNIRDANREVYGSRRPWSISNNVNS
jgi:hypothetical protein